MIWKWAVECLAVPIFKKVEQATLKYFYLEFQLEKYFAWLMTVKTWFFFRKQNTLENLYNTINKHIHFKAKDSNSKKPQTNLGEFYFMFINFAMHIVKNRKRMKRLSRCQGCLPKGLEVWDFYNTALLNYPNINKA